MEIKKAIKEVVENAPLEVSSINSNEIKERLQAINNVGLAIKSALIPGITNDYDIIPGCGNKPSLLQPGARKIVQMFGLKTKFEMISSDKTRCVMKCILELPNGEVISESFGGCSLSERGKTAFCENNLIKFAQKRAMVGAVLQVANLSKVFTQDVEDTFTNQNKISENEIKKLIMEIANKNNLSPQQVLVADGITNKKEMLTKEYLAKLKGRL